MATYFHGNSEILGSADGFQTLIFMNPAYLGFSDTQQPPLAAANTSNFVFLNSNSSGNTRAFPHGPPSHAHHFEGIPLQPSTSTSLASTSTQARLHYNRYNQAGNSVAATESSRAQQGLSLSLSSEVSNGLNAVQTVLLSSKYLKAAQDLLDEVANVGKGIKSGMESDKGNHCQVKNRESPVAEDRQSGGEGGAKRGPEFTSVERQEIQMKKAKLVNMLDEVDQRYRQYHHQMQIVISWFEQAAGIGSAKSYTALALQTISKQFRCLKDAILGQIKAASKSLGEEEISVENTEGSRLKYVDNQIRRQRALQQLGMIQHNAWRPQRGLPERSVSVLRAWLFEHFLHPYPKDSDKIMLAKQTGLTRSQVSNWFINARVRLWKPMVEEMYKEEVKGNDTNGSGDKHSESELNNDLILKSIDPQAKSPQGTQKQNKNINSKQENHLNHSPSMSMPADLSSPTGSNIRNHSVFNLMGSSEMTSITQGSPKKPRNAGILHSPSTVQSMNFESKHSDRDIDLMSLKFGSDQQITSMGAPTNFIGGFGSYPLGERGTFGAEQYQAPFSGNGVSLTLGLQHCDNLPMSSAHQTFLRNQNIQIEREIEVVETNDLTGMNTPASTHSSNIYDHINFQNRWRATSQLLHSL